MNSKATAAILAAVMALAGAVAVVSDGSDAASIDGVMVQVGGSVVTDTFGINEGNYSHYDYTLTWNIAIGDGEATPIGTVTNDPDQAQRTFIPTDVTSNAGFDVGMSEGDQIGTYQLTFKGKQVTAETNYTLSASLLLTISGATKTLTYDSIAGSVEVRAPTGAIEVTIDSTDAKKGEYFDEQVQSTSITVGYYSWYAVGLPAGLSMNADGHVVGIPTEAVTGKTFKVFATDDSGLVYYDASVEITVADKQAPTKTGFEYKVNGTYASQYIFGVGEDIVLSLTDDSGGQITTGATVTVIDTDETGTEELPYVADSNGYVLPSDGTGAYKVIVSYGDETVMFDVYIVADAAVLAPEIVIIGGS